MNEVFVRLIHLPSTVKGFITTDDDGDYNIYINDNLTERGQAVTLCHELQHLEKGHCESPQTATECERAII